MIKSRIMLLVLLLATSALACRPQECRQVLDNSKTTAATKSAGGKTTVPQGCKTHEQYNAEEAAKREQDRIDRMKYRQQLIKDKLGLD